MEPGGAEDLWGLRADEAAGALHNPSGAVRGCILTMERHDDTSGPAGSAAT